MDDLLPTISVIVPVYNGVKTIERCIKSLLQQNYPADLYDIIVVDNNSKDDTASIVQKYPVRLLKCIRRGPAPARNTGIAAASGQIIVFTDADCIAHREWLAEMIKPYADPQIGGVGGNISPYQHLDRNFVERFSEEHSPLVNFIGGEHEFLPRLYTANASYRKTALQQTDGFNEGMITGEDVDLAWRVQIHTGLKLAYAPNAIIYHHHRSTYAGLSRQYRNYGFGEILLDTLYRPYQGYPRGRAFQIRRIVSQIAAFGRYLPAVVFRYYRLMRGQISDYDAALPFLWILIEGSNVWGKFEGFIATRGMTDAGHVIRQDSRRYINRYY